MLTRYGKLSPVHTGDKVEINTVDFVESRLLPKPATNWQQSRLLPYTFNFAADTFHCVAHAVDLVASVYGAKAIQLTLLLTLSTFNKVNGVELNFVASVYRALGRQINIHPVASLSWI